MVGYLLLMTLVRLLLHQKRSHLQYGWIIISSLLHAHTWIDIKNDVHVKRDGVFVRTEQNKVFVETELLNKNNDSKKVNILHSILDKNGIEITATQSKTKITSEQNVTADLEISNPKLWSVESPYLYTLKTELFIGKELLAKFGVRDIEWKTETGMWINGKNVKLQGVCNHQDAGALGAAVPDKILRFRRSSSTNTSVLCYL